MIFLEYVGSRASLSAKKTEGVDYSTPSVFVPMV